MSDEVTTAIIGATAGLITGGLSSLVAPWASWRVEKVRLRQERRAALLVTWRTALADALRENRVMPADELQRLDWYQTLRPHLLPERRKELEDRSSIKIVRGGPGYYVSRLRAEIERIEKNWGLV